MGTAECIIADRDQRVWQVYIAEIPFSREYTVIVCFLSTIGTQCSNIASINLFRDYHCFLFVIGGFKGMDRDGTVRGDLISKFAVVGSDGACGW